MRDESLKDGEAKRIAKVLLEPVLRARPEKVGPRAWLEQVVGTEERSIKRYRVQQKFQMPGVLHLSANVKRQGMGKRKIRKNTELFVRDDASSNFIDVEVVGRSREGEWFSCDRIEFGRSVLPFIKPILVRGPLAGWQKERQSK